MRYFRKCLHLLLMAFLAILLLICFAFVGMQTDSFKQLLKEKLSAAAREAGITLSIGSMEGAPPFRWVIRDLSLEIDAQNRITIEKVQIRFAFFPLWKKELAISYLGLSKTDLLFSETTSPLPSLNLPFTLSVRTLKADKISVKKYETEETGLFSFRGSAKLKKRISGFLVKCKLSSEDHSNSFIQLYSKGGRRSSIETILHVECKSSEAFSPFFTTPLNGDGYFEARLSGAWEGWEALFANASSPHVLAGSIKSRINRLEIPHLKVANRKWTLDSLFRLTPGKEFSLDECTLSSNLLHLTSSATLSNTFHLRDAQAHFTLPNLSLLSLYLPTTLKGSLTGQLSLHSQRGVFEIHSDNLEVGMQKYSQLSALLKGVEENQRWSARAELIADHPQLPMIAHSDLKLEEGRFLTIQEFSLTAPETKLAGNLDIDLTTKDLEGAFFTQILSLKPYRVWAQPYSGLEGAFASTFHFSGQKVDGHLFLKNFHYLQASSQEATIDFSLYDLFDKLYGTLSIEGKDLHISPLYLSSYDFKTEYDGRQGAYHLFTQGEWREPLRITTSGVWKKDSLSVESLYGTLLAEDFLLSKPCSLTKMEDSLDLSECELHIGDGHLVTALRLHEQYSKGYLKTLHFPLELLLISHPSFTLGGSAHIDAAFEGSSKDLSGHFDLELEQLKLYQSAKPDPLQAKGDLHATLKDKVLKIENHFLASEGEFFNGHFSIPIDYHLYPFKIWLNHRLPLSGDIALKGKVEEIFDFVNLGSHRVSGLIRSELALSNTLEAPHLSGYLDLSEGSYENYYTGTDLKNIDAHLVAQGDKIELDHFQANDAEEGRATATGELLLQPKAKFPYITKINLENVNLLNFDMIQSHFSGPFSLHGNREGATMEGSLSVSKAEFSIPDTVAPDLPTIPVTYVNKPTHLDAHILAPPLRYPLALQLDLTAPGPLYLRGRGLRSEWRGAAKLSGTNTHVLASGNLELTKGEFLFAGKVFSLTQGEITFTDQHGERAYINLKGELQLPEIMVTVILNGPLSAPALTFQSTPHLPTSSIISYILFGKDIAEITAFQALQVAQSIITLSGGTGPDVLEKIRKSIGVDRLNIVSSAQDPDKAALQIGKYLTKGVMVTLAQGFNSSQVIVEVELKYGFSLQAETQEVEEGKFSLKWNRNY